MTIAVCPGSFDPVTLGHVDVVARAAVLFDEVIVAVGVNPAKTASRGRLFSDEERIAMLEQALAAHPTVRVAGFTGLLTAFCAEQGARAIVKGVRAASDVDYELPMAQMNAALTQVQTVLLPAGPQWSFVSSSLVKEVASLGGDVSGFVPEHVLGPLLARLAERAAAT